MSNSPVTEGLADIRENLDFKSDIKAAVNSNVKDLELKSESKFHSKDVHSLKKQFNTEWEVEICEVIEEDDNSTVLEQSMKELERNTNLEQYMRGEFKIQYHHGKRRRGLQRTGIQQTCYFTMHF